MAFEPIITREIADLPDRRDDVHKGEVGRIAVVGGCCDEILMVGAPALAANASLRSGAGLVQLLVPETLRAAAAGLAPCATTRSLPVTSDALLGAIAEFQTDVVALGPGLGRSLAPGVIADVLIRFDGPIVIDADGLNQLSSAKLDAKLPKRVVMTPHPGEARRLFRARGAPQRFDAGPGARREAACALAESFGSTVVLKGRGTVVTDGDRLYVNETGNAGMATGGSGDVLTGVIAALLGQGMEPLEASILGVYLHGLAGDFAAEELGRWSVTASDLIEHLAEAFCEHQLSTSE